MEITYDPQKSERNRRERGFDFEITRDFDFTNADYTEDRRRDYGEVRIRAIGLIGNVLYALVFTPRGGRLRVIRQR